MPQQPQPREFYISRVADLDITTLSEGVRYHDRHPIYMDNPQADSTLFSELKNTGEFKRERQEQLKRVLKESEQEDRDFATIIRKYVEIENEESYYATLKALIDEFTEFQERYHESIWFNDVTQKAAELQERAARIREREINEILQDPNAYRPDEIVAKLDRTALQGLCDDLGLDINFVLNYTDYRDLEFVDLLPMMQDDVPMGYTDVFFWGLPSSGKTCALAALMYTMNKKYAFADADIPKSYGVAYRNSLVNVFNNELAYLPPANPVDKTQYMPFELNNRNASDGFRKISFFELSGEIIHYIYDLQTGTNRYQGEALAQVQRAWKSLNLVLNSPNNKLHVFFIDYEKSDKNAITTQEQYLSAAANYFNNKLNIFEKHTHGIYLIITKADRIPGENKIRDAKEYLQNNFNNFYEIMKLRSKKGEIAFKVKLFSIGDVYFKGICRLSTYYTENLIDSLMSRIIPENESFWAKIKRYFQRVNN